MTSGVTVLMPVYNASEFLRDAIISILNQSFSDFEFLIIDDASTDNSVEIIHTFNDPRIRLLRNERNLGISATLNRGIEEARHDLIARMDADDMSHRMRLEKQMSYMEKNPACGLLSTWTNVISAAGNFVTIEKHPHEFYYYNLTFECWIYHPTVMFRREVVRACGMYSREYSEDYDLFWKIARRFKIHNLDEPLLDYRISPYSLNTVLRKTEYERANRENVLRNIRHYMGEHFELPDPCIECLRHNFGPILHESKVSMMLESLEILRRITNAILEIPNVNHDRNQILRAYLHKKEFIVEQLFLQLTGFNKFYFIIRSNQYAVLGRKIQKSIRWRYKYAVRHLKALTKR